MFIERNLLNKIKRLKKSFLLIGPRQTGKSTLIQELNPDLEINLANEQQFIDFLANPALLEEMVGNNKTIAIDEIQRIPSMLNTVQYLSDKDKTLQFYLTGSSARKLKRGKANLLPGRVLTYHLGPLCLEELGDSLDVGQLLQKGLLPGVYTEENTELWQKILRSYASTYLKEEIQAEALTRNLEGFTRFFNIVASRSGDFLDISKFSKQAQIERTTAKRYFEILEDTLVIYSVEAFSKSKRRRLVQHPRYYFFDVGVLNGALNNFEVSADRIGNLFEHLVIQLIKASFMAQDRDLRISVYRTERGAEVDFIIEKEKEVLAVEVKASKTIGKHDLRGFKSFNEFYKKNHEAIVIYLGDKELNIDGISIKPFFSGVLRVCQK